MNTDKLRKLNEKLYLEAKKYCNENNLEIKEIKMNAEETTITYYNYTKDKYFHTIIYTILNNQYND